MNEQALLREFAATRSEEALAALLRQYLPLVYSVALRQTSGDTLLAGEIAQETFCIFARKVGAFSEKVVLSAWLCRTAVYLAQKAVRSERRRHAREREAYQMQQQLSNSPDLISWEDLSPQIDAALDLLPENDRCALILRFFERKPTRELAQHFGVSEEAARMRISRALDRLRTILGRKGLPVGTAAGLALLLEENINAANLGVPGDLLGTVESRLQREAVSGAARDWKLRPAEMFKMAAGFALLISLPLLALRPKNLEPAQASSTQTVSSNGSPSNGSATELSATPKFDFDAAAAALRKALRDPWPSLVPPYDRVDQALASYGRYRAAAAPVLMEMLLGERSKHTYQSQMLSAHGLIVLGPDAAETLDDLLILHDSSDLHFLDDGEADLFAAIDFSGSSIPKLMEELSDGRCLPVTSLILVKLFRQNPGIAPFYKDDLLKLLRLGPPFTDRAALILAQVPSLYDRAVLPPLFQRLREEDHGDFAVRAIRRQAITALRELRIPEAVPVLLELGRRPSEPSDLRDAAMLAIVAIDPSAATTSEDVRSWYAAHEEGLRLAEKARKNEATAAELALGLNHSESVSAAAQQLSQNPPLLVQHLPELLESLEKFADTDAQRCLKVIPSADLIAQLQAGNSNGLREVVQFLSLLPNRPAPEVCSALAPLLDGLLESLDPAKFDKAFSQVRMAIFQLDGTYPFFYLDEFASRQVGLLLGDLVESAPSKRQLIEPAEAFLRGRRHTRRATLTKFLDPIFADPELRRAVQTHPRFSDVAPFLTLPATAGTLAPSP